MTPFRCNRIIRLMVLGVGCMLFLVSGGCRKRPAGILSEKEMESLMSDMLLADAYEQSSAGRNMPDSVRRNLGESILEAHGVDRAVLDSTYIWYGSNLDEYYKLYSKVQKRLEKQKSKLDGASVTSPEEKGNDIWQLPRHIRFSPLGTGDALVWELPAEAIGKGDRLEWEMWIGTSAESTLQLGLDYSDGTTAIIERVFRGDKKPSVKLTSDTSKVVSRVYGVMRVERDAMPLTADSIKLLRLPFDSTEYRNTWSQRLFYGPKPRPVPVKVTNDTVMEDSTAIR